MRRLLLLGALCLAGCKSSPPPEPNATVNVNAPGVGVRVMDDGGVKVFGSAVPTIIVPGSPGR